MEQDWTTRTILEWIENYLAQHGDANPRLSAQWLVSDALSCSRLELYTQLDRVLRQDEKELLRSYTARRKTGEPLQYITGTTDFRFITLNVEPDVLIPRPETEVLVSEALDALGILANERSVGTTPATDLGDLSLATLVSLDDAGLFLQMEGAEPIPVAIDPDGDLVLRIANDAADEQLLVVDLCTGSGNVACALASEYKNLRILATDISHAACALARRNVDSLGLGDRVFVAQCDLGDALPGKRRGEVDVVVSNPPYIPTKEIARLDSEVKDFEPVLALDGGPDGLDVFRRILVFSRAALKPGGFLVVELHETCLDAAAAEATASGFAEARIVRDLAGKPRILVARIPFE